MSSDEFSPVIFEQCFLWGFKTSSSNLLWNSIWFLEQLGIKFVTFDLLTNFLDLLSGLNDIGPLVFIALSDVRSK